MNIPSQKANHGNCLMKKVPLYKVNGGKVCPKSVSKSVSKKWVPKRQHPSVRGFMVVAQY